MASTVSEPEAKRSFVLDGIGTELELGRVTCMDSSSDREMIYLEKMRDGKWRLTYTKQTIPDITKLHGLRLRRWSE